MKKYIVCLISLLFLSPLMAQEPAQQDSLALSKDVTKDKSESSGYYDLKAELVSEYLYRGQQLSSVALQPNFEIGYKGLSFSISGSVGLKPQDPNQIDLTLAYSFKGFEISILDTWMTDNNPIYFDYSEKTAHSYEATASYDFGFLSLSWSTIFAGLDGVNKAGNRAYTSYFEITAPFHLVGLDWEGTFGAVPYSSDYYKDSSNGFSVTNLFFKASKEFDLRDNLSLPIYASLIANPTLKKLWFVLSLALDLHN